MTMPVLEARGLPRSFGHARALDEVGFEAHPREVTAPIGDNAAGKSTPVKALSGNLAVEEGTIKFEDLGVQYSPNESSTATVTVTSALQKAPDTVGIFAANIFTAAWTATGVQQVGMQGGVTIIDFDAGPAQVEQLRAATVQALVGQEPTTIGRDGVEQVITALNREPIEKDIQTGFTIITQDVVDGEVAAAHKSSCCLFRKHEGRRDSPPRRQEGHVT